jgi:hypothetical protein
MSLERPGFEPGKSTCEGDVLPIRLSPLGNIFINIHIYYHLIPPIFIWMLRYENFSLGNQSFSRIVPLYTW